MDFYIAIPPNHVESVPIAHKLKRQDDKICSALKAQAL